MKNTKAERESFIIDEKQQEFVPVTFSVKLSSAVFRYSQNIRFLPNKGEGRAMTARDVIMVG